MTVYVDIKDIYDDAAADYPQNHFYCLVDHAGMPGLHRELVRSGVSWSSLFEGSREENAMQVAPLLCCLDGEVVKDHSYLLRWLEEHGTYTSSMLLLSSPLSLAELNRRLAQRLQARVSEQMDIMLRYFDPRTFESLLPALTADQRDVFLSVADCWWYLDRSGEPVQQTACFEPTDRFESPLVLSARQEFALLDASEADQVGALVQQMAPEPYRQVPLPRRHAFIKRHMEAAGKSGIVATHELALYCGLALFYGEDFARSQSWRGVLERVQSGKISLSDAVANQEGDVVHEV